MISREYINCTNPFNRWQVGETVILPVWSPIYEGNRLVGRKATDYKTSYFRLLGFGPTLKDACKRAKCKVADVVIHREILADNNAKAIANGEY